MTLKPETIEESTIPDPIKSRINEIDEQIANAEKMLSGEDIRAAQAARYGFQLPRQEIQKEIQKARVQRSLLIDEQRLYERIQRAEAAINQPGIEVDTQALANAKQAYEQNKPIIEAITNKDLSPFVDLDSKGNVRIDVRTAVNSGVSRDLLKRAGISGGQQEIVRIKLRKEKEALQQRAEARKKQKESIRQAGSIFEHEALMSEISESQRSAETFEKQNTRLADGRYMSNADFNSLPKYEQNIAKNKGFDALQEHWNKKQAGKFTLPVEVARIYRDATPEDKFSILKAYERLPENAKYTGSKNGEPEYRIGNGVETFVMSGFTEFIVENTVPLVRTIGKWNQMNTGEKALSIAVDALFFLPFIRAASTGAKATTAVTRAGRFAGAARGIGSQLILETKAPIEVMLHPIQTVKGIGKGAWNILENVANIRKLPEAVISNTYGTVRVPVLAGMTPDDALRARQQILTAIEKSGGKGVTLELNGYRFTFNPGALSRETGGLAHATPQGDAFLQGIKVKAKPGMPMTEQGIFVSPEPLPRFTRSTAFGSGGDMPTIFITSPDTALDAINTSKLYKSRFGTVAELEKKFPVDYEIPAPKQILYTRLGPELTKTVVMLEKPLSKAQIAKLKSLAIIEDLKAPFKPALLIEDTSKIKGAARFTETIDAREIRELTRILERSGNRSVARNLRAVWNGLENAREVTRRETQEATRGRGSARIGIGTMSVGSRTGAADPERVMFNIRAEKIGRTVRIGDTRKPSEPIRITNREAPRGKTSVRDTTETTGKPRAVVEESEETPVRPRRDGDSEGESGILRIPRKEEEVKRKVYKPKSQKEARKIIREAKIAVGWRQGQLHGKHRYDVIVDPFTPAEEYLIIMGKRPQGVRLVRGPRSAYNSAQTLSGHLGKAGTVDMPGLFYVEMMPIGQKKIWLKFQRDANISNRKRVFPLNRKDGEK